MKRYAGLFAAALTCAALSMSAFAEGDVLETFVSDDNVTIELVGIEGDTSSGYTWNIHAVNKMDKEVLIPMNDLAINGLILDPDPYNSIRLAPEEDVVTDVTWSSDKFEGTGITDVREVRFSLYAFDTETYNSFLEEDYCYCPDGEEGIEYYSYTPTDQDTVVLDNDNVTMVFTGAGVNYWNEFTMNFVVQNKSDNAVYFSAENWKLNGSVEADPYWAKSLPAKTCANVEIYFSEYSLEGTGIQSIESLDCDFIATDYSSWDEVGRESFSLTLDEAVAVNSGEVSTEAGELPEDPDPTAATESVEVFEVNPEEAVRSTGAQGKSWTDFFAAK